MQLHAAARRGDLSGLEYCLSRGNPVDLRDKQGNTPLLAALSALRVFERLGGPCPTAETIRLLLEAGADVNSVGELGMTPAHAAVQTGRPEIVKLLAERGGDFGHVTESGYTTMVHACYQPASKAKREILQFLFERGVSLDRASNYGECPLSVSLYFGDFEALRFLIELGASPVALGWNPLQSALVLATQENLLKLRPTPDDLGYRMPRWELTPLLLAVKTGQWRNVAWLVENGAALDAVGRSGTTALHIAATHDHLEVLQGLIEQGADPECVDDFGVTPLVKAAENDACRCIAALIQRGANVKCADNYGGQPIHHARSLDALKLLVELGQADVNTVDGCGDWPLKGAAEDNDAARARWLLEKGAVVDRTSTGETALHSAVSRDSREVAQLLLARGADVNSQDVDGWTPLFGAKSREMIQLLLSSGADPSIRDQAETLPATWIQDPLLLEILPGPTV